MSWVMTSPAASAAAEGGGGGTRVSGGAGASTGGRASAVVVGGFFLQAPARGRSAAARIASAASGVECLFIPSPCRINRFAPGAGVGVVGNIARSLRQPHRLEIVSGIGQLPLVLSVQVHRVNVGAAAAARRVDDLLSVRRPRRVTVRPFRRASYGLTGREVHQADVEVPLVAAGEGDRSEEHTSELQS